MVVILTLGVNGDKIVEDNYTQYSDGQPRIYGGYRARSGQFPHQASLRVDFSNGFNHECGGSIITNRFILTAAHCIPVQYLTEIPKRFRLVLGAHNQQGDGDTYAVQRIIIHPEWDPNLFIHDIALVQTVEQIVFSATVRPIPVSRQFTIAGRAVTSGWGRTNVSFRMSYLNTSCNYQLLYTVGWIYCIEICICVHDD